MLQHVRTYFPNQYRLGGEKDIRADIHYAIERAARYGYDTDNNFTLIMFAGALVSLSDRRLRVGAPKRARTATPSPAPAE